MITFEDFKKVEIKVGKILAIEKIPDTEKLLKLKVDFGLKQFSSENRSPENSVNQNFLGLKPAAATAAGSPSPAPVASELGEETLDIRQIVSGIALYFPDPQVLLGKKCMFVTNLEPRVIKRFESNGMLFAVSTDDGKFSLLEPSGDIPEGTTAK
ncbi:MAG: hypothetical protein ABI430_04560 [Candidatus Taylorbacteria bacterium]